MFVRNTRTYSSAIRRSLATAKAIASQRRGVGAAGAGELVSWPTQTTRSTSCGSCGLLWSHTSSSSSPATTLTWCAHKSCGRGYDDNNKSSSSSGMALGMWRTNNNHASGSVGGGRLWFSTTADANRKMERSNLNDEIAAATTSASPTSTETTTTTTTTTSDVKSWKKRFREITVYPEILEHIREIGVGIMPRQRKAKKLDQITSRATGDRRRIAKVVGGLAAFTAPPRPNTMTRKQLLKQQQQQQQQPDQQQQQAGGRSNNPNNPESTSSAKSASSSFSPSPFEPPRPFGKSSFPVRVVGELDHPDQELPLFMDNVPQRKIPQVAICGRSNVGKSTLLNLLLYSNLAAEYQRRKRLLLDEELRNKRARAPNTFHLPKGIKAVTSDKPGETKKITFYQLGSPHPTQSDMDLRMLLVDLPGYGFAFANPTDRKNFQQMMRRYLTGGLKNQDKSILKRILLLIDARHGFLPADEEFLDMIQRTLVTHAATAIKAKNTDEILKVIAKDDDNDDEEDGGYDDIDYLDDEDDDNDDDEEEEDNDTFGRTRKSGRDNKNSYSERSLEQDRKNKRKKRIEVKQIIKTFTLPPIQIVLTKCDLVAQVDLARRVVQVREQLSDALIREPSEVLPVMLVSSRTNHGVLEVQKQLAYLAEAIDPIAPTTSLAPTEKKPTKKASLRWLETPKPPPPLMPNDQPQKKPKKKTRKSFPLAPTLGSTRPTQAGRASQDLAGGRGRRTTRGKSRFR